MINAFLQTVPKHIIAESTNLQATYDAKHVFNVKASANIDNGKVVNLDDMAYEANEYFTMVEPTATSRVGLIISVPIGPDETPRKATLESNFYNGAGEIMRVYDLLEGDRFTISENGISGVTPAKGVYIVADGYDLKGQAAKPSNVAFYGEIIEKIVRTGGVFWKILVRKNG